MSTSVSNTIVLKPVIEAIEGGWQAYAHMYEDRDIFTAVEIFNAYDDRQEAWDNAKQGAQEVADKHNKTCRCSKKMIVGSF